MPTNDERREVAERLRSLAGGYVTIGEIEMALGIRPSSKEVDLERDARNLRHLADLIEPSCDRERLLSIATVMAKDSIVAAENNVSVNPPYIFHQARYIAESCGETLESIRSRDVQEVGVSIIPEEAIVDRDALLELADEFEDTANELLELVGEAGDDIRPYISNSAEGALSYARRIREACGEGER